MTNLRLAIEHLPIQLAEVQMRTEQTLDRIMDGLDKVRSGMLELLFDKKAPAYFGRRLRGARVVETNQLLELVEGKLDEADVDDLLLIDAVVQGQLRGQAGNPAVWLAVEISAVVDRRDVTRAVRRAEALRRAGLAALPVVAGDRATEGAQVEAEKRGVAILLDGTILLWDEALSTWPVPP